MLVHALSIIIRNLGNSAYWLEFPCMRSAVPSEHDRMLNPLNSGDGANRGRFGACAHRPSPDARIDSVELSRRPYKTYVLVARS